MASPNNQLADRLIEIVRNDLKAWQRAAKKHRKNGNELAEEMCLAGAQNDEQLLKKMEKAVRGNHD